MTYVDYWIFDFKKNWSVFLTNTKNIKNLVLAISLFSVVSYLFRLNLEKFEKIQGVLLNDFLLDILPTYDMSMEIFIILYFTVFAAFIFLLAYPVILNYTFGMYTIALSVRLMMLFLINLEPPVGMKLLYDPILAVSTYNGLVITKDLFFSGHCVSMFVCYFGMPNNFLRKMFGVFSLILTFMILIQHIHYTIDVLGAYIVVFLIYKVYFRQQLKNNNSIEHYSPELIDVQYH